MKQKKRISSIALITWFLFVMIFLSAWNADRFVSMMQRELPGITPDNAKLHTNSWDASYTRYFRFMQPLAEVSGAAYLVLDKKSVDNYSYVKDQDGNMQLVEDNFDRERAEAQILALSDAFENRGIPFLYVSMPPRFDKADFMIAQELDFFGQRDEQMLAMLSASGVDTLDMGQQLKDAGTRYLYPFKTDIHLETEGEFLAAQMLSDKLSSLSVEIRNQSVIFDKGGYTISPQSFTGNLVKSSGVSYTLGNDRFELWFPDFDTDLTIENPETGVTKSGPFTKSVMNGMESPEALAKSANPYWILDYLQYPSAYYTIKNNMCGQGPKLLFIIDSYAMRTVSFLSLGASEITVIDPRGVGSAEYLSEAMQSGKYDAVIVAAGGKEFYDNLNVN